jgi:hypothetical protein
MTERQLFRAIVRGVGVYLGVFGVEHCTFILWRLLSLFPSARYQYTTSQDFLDASVVTLLGYLLIRKPDWIVRFAYGRESEP